MTTEKRAWYERLILKLCEFWCNGKRSKSCTNCRKLLMENEDNKKLADLLEVQHSKCECEKFSVGHMTPGRVKNGKRLHRIIASPRDFDPATGIIAARPFEKVFSNGLSVWRDQGPDEHIRILFEEALVKKASDPVKEIYAVCEARAGDIRRKTNDVGEQLFCVYDQTVSRLDPKLPPVPTHAGVFLRIPPPNSAGRNRITNAERKRIQKDYALWLRDKFIEGKIAAVDYRNGICLELNRRAAAGEFDRS